MEHWIELIDGIAAGSLIPSDCREESIQVEQEYDEDHYAVQVFGGLDGGPKSEDNSIPNGSIIIVRRLKNGQFPRRNLTVIYSDANGSTLKEGGDDSVFTSI